MITAQDDLIENYERDVKKIINSDSWKEKRQSASLETIALPNDLVLFSSMAVSNDSTRIAIAGGERTDQKIYTAAFVFLFWTKKNRTNA